MDKDEAAAFWAKAHTDAGRPDPSAEMAKLESAVYSRAGSAESVVDFVDPVTGETVRATPSQLRLLAFRARQAAEVDARNLAVPPTADFESTAAVLPGPTIRTRRRFVLPLAVSAAVAVGIVIALIVPSFLTSIDGDAAPVASAGTVPLRFFDYVSVYSDIPVPDLGDRFVAESIRNISGTSEAVEGFGVFLGREADSGLYCLIVNSAVNVSVADCATADAVAQQGLLIESAVMVRSFVASDAPFGDTVLTATLTSRGKLSMSFPPTAPGEVGPPPTTGTTLQEWSSGPTDATFSAEVDAHGEGLIIALACLGEGSVTVDVDGSAYLFACTAGTVMRFRNFDDTAHGLAQVTVSPTANVTWGLTVASSPRT